MNVCVSTPQPGRRTPHLKLHTKFMSQTCLVCVLSQV